MPLGRSSPKRDGILGDVGDFLHARLDEAARFVQHVVVRAGAVAAADERDGAVGAAVVAPIAHTDEGGKRRGRQNARGFKHLAACGAGDGARAVERTLDQIADMRIIRYAHQQVDFRHLLLQRLAVALHKAARRGQQTAVACLFVFGHLEDGVDAFLLCGVDKPAGVDDNHLRVGRIGGDFPAARAQQAQHLFGVDSIFCAAQRDHADCFCHGEFLRKCEFMFVL